MSEDRGPMWRAYEQSIRDLLAAMGDVDEVKRDVKVNGRLSGEQRQIDVLVTGTVAGDWMTVAVECKRHGRPVGIGIVDAFVGKLLDVGADRGLLYSWSGFTEGARRRAAGALNPKIKLVDASTEPTSEIAAGLVDEGAQVYRIAELNVMTFHLMLTK